MRIYTIIISLLLLLILRQDSFGQQKNNTKVLSTKNTIPNKIGNRERKPKLAMYQSVSRDSLDNEFKNQENGKANGFGDKGMPNVVPINLKIDLSKLNDQTGKDELGEEKVVALINVNTSGIGTLLKIIAKKSTTTNKKYQNAIINCLPKIKFAPSSSEYKTEMTFDFRLE